MAKNITEKNVHELSESTKKVYSALKEHGYKVDHTVAILVKDETDEYKVSQNYFSTGIKFNKSELNLDELIQDGIHIWRTWTYRG